MSSESEALLTPGQQLKRARLAKGITLAQISERTLIVLSRLESLENDDYSAAGSASTYVVGYLKSYAALVGIDPKTFIKVIDSHFEQTQSEKKPESYVIIKPAGRIPWLSIAAAVLALVIFVGLGQWFFSQESKPVLADRSAVNELSLPSLNGQASISAASEDELLPDSVVADVDVVNHQDPQALATPETAADVMNPDNNAAVQPTIVATSAAALQVANTNEDALASSPANITVAEVLGDADASDQLTLHLSDDCWVEIFDAARKKLISRLVTSGQTIRLRGSAPFDVKVGNVSAVNLSVNGRAVELNPSDGQRVLRLQVGP